MRRGSPAPGPVSPPPRGWKPDEPKSPDPVTGTPCWDGSAPRHHPCMSLGHNCLVASLVRPPPSCRGPSGVVSVSALRAGRRGGGKGGAPRGAAPTRARAPTTRGWGMGVSAQAPCGRPDPASPASSRGGSWSALRVRGWLGPGRGGERRPERGRARAAHGLQCPPPDGRAQDGSRRRGGPGARPFSPPRLARAADGI